MRTVFSIPIRCGHDRKQSRHALIFHTMGLTGTMDVRAVPNVCETVSDLQARHNAGVGVSVGVLSGAHNRERLERESHTGLIESIAGLPAFLE